MLRVGKDKREKVLRHFSKALVFPRKGRKDWLEFSFGSLKKGSLHVQT